MENSLKIQKLLLLFLLTLSSLEVLAQKSFNQSKDVLKNKIYGHKGNTFYCACPFQKKSIKSKKCPLEMKRYRKRQKRLEWEHVVPTSAFGHSFASYRNAKKVCKTKKKSLSPRKCATKKNKLFKQMAANLHNLVPVVGAINAMRSNFSFEDNLLKGTSLCKQGFRILNNKVSPPKAVKGNIARIYLYMDQKYPGRGIISHKRKKMFTLWDSIDPPDKEECRLNQLKANFQGEENPFVASKCSSAIKSH